MVQIPVGHPVCPKRKKSVGPWKSQYSGLGLPLPWALSCELQASLSMSCLLILQTSL